MASLTRFKGRDGKDGPVSGALMVIPVSVPAVANSSTIIRRVDLPAGMQFEVTDVMWSAQTITSDPTLSVGTTSSGTQIAAAVNLTTASAAGQIITIKDGSVAAAGSIYLAVIADAGDAVSRGHITIVGYASAPPTSAVVRGQVHY